MSESAGPNGFTAAEGELVSSDGERKLRFRCPHCDASLKVPCTLAGQVGLCPHCQKTIRAPSVSSVSGGPRRDAGADTARVGVTKSGSAGHSAPTLVPVVCRVCGSRLYASLEQVGETIECPDCFSSNEVRAPSPIAQRVSSPSLGSQSDEYHVRDDVNQPPPSDQVLVPVVCTVCGTRMYASEEQIGQTVVCPDCDTVNQVRAPHRPVKRKFSPSAATVPYDVGQAQRVTAPHQAMQEVLELAAKNAEEAERTKPKPPRHPFFTKVYTFPFQARTGIACMSLTIATMMVFAAVSTVAQMSPMLIPIVCAAAALTASALFTVASVFFISIIETTANCQDKIERWPEFGIVDWILQSFYLVNSLTFSLLPLLILASLLPGYTAVAYGLGLLLAMLLFPVVLLSMLEETTCMMPYSAVVWRSLTRTWWAWLLFHLHAVGLLAVLGLAGWAGFVVPNEWTMLLFVAVALVLMTVYFRLLGRLAYVIGRESDERPEDETSIPG